MLLGPNCLNWRGVSTKSGCCRGNLLEISIKTIYLNLKMMVSKDYYHI